MVSDREVWDRICKGDVGAFEEIYRMHGRNLEIFLRRVLGSKHAAEDVMQETFTQIWRRPNGFDADRGTLRAYLFGAGRKRAAEWWRKQSSHDSPHREPTESRTETESIVNDAFAHLTEEQRALIWLREVEGHSYSELSQILQIPIGTVRSRLFTAREDLRKIWHSQSGGKREEL